MRKISFLFLFLLITLSATAQTDDNMPRRLTISGQVMDAEFREPMAQATIQLFTVTDSVFVGGTVSDNRGNFSVEAPNNGTFRLKISSVGFQTIQRDVTLRRGQNQELGTLLMSPESIMLKEAVITGRAAQVIVKKDTLVYNPDAFRTPEGSAIEELIKRMPGAEVDEDGNITVNGKEVKKILIDGKEFMLGDTETALKNLPISIIQNVKFYDQQSDQARITGIEDGNKETVLDFTIKKGMNHGYMTNLDLAGGTQHRYASRGMASSFTDNTRIMVTGNFNNKEEVPTSTTMMARSLRSMVVSVGTTEAATISTRIAVRTSTARPIAPSRTPIQRVSRATMAGMVISVSSGSPTPSRIS